MKKNLLLYGVFHCTATKGTGWRVVKSNGISMETLSYKIGDWEQNREMKR